MLALSEGRILAARCTWAWSVPAAEEDVTCDWFPDVEPDPLMHQPRTPSASGQRRLTVRDVPSRSTRLPPHRVVTRRACVDDLAWLFVLPVIGTVCECTPDQIDVAPSDLVVVGRRRRLTVTSFCEIAHPIAHLLGVTGRYETNLVGHGKWT